MKRTPCQGNAPPSRAAIFMPEQCAPEPVPGTGVWGPGVRTYIGQTILSPVPMPHPWQAKKRSSDPASLGHAPVALDQNAKTHLAATLHGGHYQIHIFYISVHHLYSTVAQRQCRSMHVGSASMRWISTLARDCWEAGASCWCRYRTRCCRDRSILMSPFE